MNLSKLKLKKLMNEFNYLKLDLDYKKEILSNIDKEFLKEMNKVLESNEKLKKVFESKDNNTIKDDKSTDNKKSNINGDKINSEKIESNDETESNDEIDNNVSDNNNNNNNTKSKKIKSLYREIVKLTHPDKVDDETLNELYLQATEGYDNDDITYLYSICDKLDIDYKIEDKDIEKIGSKVLELKNRSNFLEKTYTWRWMNSNNDKDKKKIIIEFINMKLNI